MSKHYWQSKQSYPYHCSRNILIISISLSGSFCLRSMLLWLPGMTAFTFNPLLYELTIFTWGKVLWKKKRTQLFSSIQFKNVRHQRPGGGGRGEGGCISSMRSALLGPPRGQSSQTDCQKFNSLYDHWISISPWLVLIFLKTAHIKPCIMKIMTLIKPNLPWPKLGHPVEHHPS